MNKTIVCHCEDVALEEVFSAVSQGYCDIESLKRYTGIGTGKCQGKCCLIQTLRVLATDKGFAAVVKGFAAGPGEPLVPPSQGDSSGYIRIPTIRQPVTPMRIDDIIEDGESRDG